MIVYNIMESVNEIVKLSKGRPRKEKILTDVVKKRGRPPKVKEPIIILCSLIDNISDSMINEIKSIPKGRPKQFDMTENEYNKMYYEKNKEKTKGNNVCDSCKVYYSKSNKSRHMNSKYHLDRVEN
jgi:hypothetical protein